MGAAALAVIVWSAHFTVIYGFTALACARQMTPLVPWVVGVVSTLALLALVAIAVPAGMRAARASRLPDFLAASLGGLSAVAIVWEASALFFVPRCA
jgi:hypothetical protein